MERSGAGLVSGLERDRGFATDGMPFASQLGRSSDQVERPVVGVLK